MEDAPSLGYVLLFLKDEIFTLSQLAFLLSRKLLHHRVDITGAFADLLSQLVHLDLLLKLLPEAVVLFRVKLPHGFGRLLVGQIA